MSEEKLKVFIDGTINYFHHASDQKVGIGTPYLVENTDPVAYDYTGIIGISGPQKGSVYFTAPKALITHLLLSLGEKETSEEFILDLIGEVANTISGNARSQFGREFMISTPVVIKGEPTKAYLAEDRRSYVIPVHWRSYRAAVVVCLHTG